MDEIKNKKGKITDKNGVIRFDFQLSYWIVIWFILYYIIDLQKNVLLLPNIFMNI